MKIEHIKGMTIEEMAEIIKSVVDIIKWIESEFEEE